MFAVVGSALFAFSPFAVACIPLLLFFAFNTIVVVERAATSVVL